MYSNSLPFIERGKALVKQVPIHFEVSCFRRSVVEACGLQGCYAALSCSLLPTFRDRLYAPSSRFLDFAVEDGTNRLSRQACNQPPTYAVFTTQKNEGLTVWFSCLTTPMLTSGINTCVVPW